MEIGRLVGDPGEEAGDGGMAAQGHRIGIGAGQFRVGQGGMDSAVTDRMDWHHLSPAPALGHGMMPFDPRAERPGAEPAGLRFSQDQGSTGPVAPSSTSSPSASPIARTR